MAEKQNKKGLTVGNLGQLQRFVENVTKGQNAPFKEKTERAKRNLKKAKLIN
jgi:hypothetical protein